MKKLLTALSILALGITTGNLGNSLNTSISANNNINENNHEITNRIDYKWHDSYGPYFSIYDSQSDNNNLLNWKEYANNWEEFINKYKSFAFDKSSYFKVDTNDNSSSVDLSIALPTVLIKTNPLIEEGRIMYDVYEWTIVSYIEAILIIWHDDNNIYFKWYEFDSIGSFWPLAIPTNFNVNLNIVKFWTTYSIK